MTKTGMTKAGMTKPTIKVLHLASFTGNIGDNANHAGTRTQFANNLSIQFDYTELEIREFFWGERHFDDNFINYVNQFQLLLIGGGNYFELWVEKSRSGCSIDLSPQQLARIEVPMLFYGLGVDAGQGVPEQCRDRFGSFLQSLLDSPKALVAVRNDGAMANLRCYFSDLPLEQILQVPDGGFFYSPPNQTHVELANPGRYIAINLAGDMAATRFPGGAGQLSRKEFLHRFAATLSEIMSIESDLRLVLIPHIYRDLDIIYQALSEFDDNIVRQRISVAPYAVGNRACDKLFDLYRHCELALATRFHANVCPVAMGTPTIGLICYPQIEHLYRELGRENWAINVNHVGFEQVLGDLITAVLHREIALPAPVMPESTEKLRTAHRHIDRWLLECLSSNQSTATVTEIEKR